MPLYKEKTRTQRVTMRGIKPKLWSMLLRYSDYLGVPIGKLVNEALEQFLRKRGRLKKDDN